MAQTLSPSAPRLRFWSPWLAVFITAWLIAYFALMPDAMALLRSNYPFILVGFAGALIGNLTALGGGIVFIPILIFAYGIPAVAALKTSIISQSCGMTSGALAWHQSGAIDWQIVRWAIPGLIAGCTLSSLIIHPSALLVKGLYGPASIAMGLALFVSLRREQAQKATYTRLMHVGVIVASFFGGMLTGWVAIGEGEVVAVLLMLAFGFTSKKAVAIGVALLSVASVYLAALHIFILGNVPWEIAAFTSLGTDFGARLAPIVASRIDQRLLKKIFAGVAIADGILFVWQYLLRPL